MELKHDLSARGVVSTTIHRVNGAHEAITQSNTITDEGLSLLLEYAFVRQEAKYWYFGLRGNGPQTPADTWQNRRWEEIAPYEGERKAWKPTIQPVGVAISQEATSYAITQEAIVRGIFLASTPSGEGGLLMLMRYPRALILYPGDTLELSYTLSIGRLKESSLLLACPTGRQEEAAGSA